jgi:hypothetical protein
MGLGDGLHGSGPAERHCIPESAIVLKVYGILIIITCGYGDPSLGLRGAIYHGRPSRGQTSHLVPEFLIAAEIQYIQTKLGPPSPSPSARSRQTPKATAS